MPAKSIAQRKLMGAAYRCKKTGVCSTQKIKKIADSMSLSSLRDFATTKHAELPYKMEHFAGFAEYFHRTSQDSL
jgi:hypothetical protein